jgi:membrane-bound metal-dependent hydrolase YbcI (DUF457 family)
MRGVPSPIGHALGGLAAGWLVAGIAPSPGRASAVARWSQQPAIRRGALFVLLGIAPDFDLLVGPHRTYSHSIGAVLIVALAALALTRAHRPRLAGACAAAWGSHVLFDWLGDDTSPPFGLMALWPFSTEFLHSPVPIFMAISRRYWRPEFVAHNTLAIVREVLILAPVMWMAWMVRRPTRSSC